MIVGVLALQGAFALHTVKLHRLGIDTLEVRTPEQLAQVDALVMPGGESTTMSLLLDSSDLFDPIAKRLADGMAVFGTCAGMILLASRVVGGRDDQRSFARLDIAVERNGYGRQVESFEAQLDVAGFDDPVHAVFIRAPRVLEVGPGIEVLATDHQGDPVLLRDGSVLAAAFHPELSDDLRIHQLFVDSVAY